VSEGWRLRGVLREALANLIASPLRVLVLGAAVGGGLAALAWTELSFSTQVKRLSQEFTAAGGYVAVVDGPLGLDAFACNALQKHDQVIAAGGMRGAGVVVSSNAPGVPFTRFEVTRGLISVLDPNMPAPPRTPGYLVGFAAGTELGLFDTGWVTEADSKPVPVTVIDPATRNEFAARAFFDLVPATGRAGQCWVEFRPQAIEDGLEWLPAVFAGDQTQARRNVDFGEFATDPATQLATRPQRWGWLAVGGVASAIIALTAIFRRADTAVYRAFGLSKTGQLLMHQGEVLTLIAACYLAANAWAAIGYAFTFQVPDLDQIILALRTTGKAAAITAALAPIGAALASAGSAASLLKDR